MRRTEDSREDCALELDTGALMVAVAVLSSPYVSWQRGFWHLRSRHGPLAFPGAYGGVLHMIALVGRGDDSFLALDPYYPAHAAFEICDIDFERFYTGFSFAVDR